MPSKTMADAVRIQHYKAFATIKCYVGDDLTLMELDRRNRIKLLMQDYWGVPSVYNARFQRD